MTHHNYRNIDQLEGKMRSHQNLPYAIIGGIAAALICALLWATISVVSGYQYAIVAIAIGFIVGIAVRYFGAGYDGIYSAVGGLCALLACVMGNVFGVVGWMCQESAISIVQGISFLNAGMVIDMMAESFSLMDLVFYGLAVFQGIALSRRQLEPGTDPSDSLEPEFSALRGPLAGTLAIAFLGFMIYLGLKGPDVHTYSYETGEKMSVGAYSGGLEQGTWEYFYQSGGMQTTGDFDQGKQVGEWIDFHENGEISVRSHFQDGLLQGDYKSYYDDGTPMSIATYENGRLNDMYTSYHPNGQLWSEGRYIMDREDGPWTVYNSDGTKISEGSYQDGSQVGRWKTYFDNGNLLEEVEYVSEDKSKLITAYSEDGRQIIRDGNGTYSYYDEEGLISSTGSILDGSPHGRWRHYLKGVMTEEGEYRGDDYHVLSTWVDGQPAVVDGEGIYETYYEGSGMIFERGQLKDGLRQGAWVMYYDSLGIPMVESTYRDGKTEGLTKVYTEEGDLYYELRYQADKVHGMCAWYFPDGTKQSEVNFENGKKQGVQKFWNGAGVLTKEEKYVDGQLVE